MPSSIRPSQGATWAPVHAGQDHLLQFTRRSAIDALAEMIWNGLDAEADLVDVSIETSSLGSEDKDLQFVTQVAITDNGHGITSEVAHKAFPSLGDSWKKSLSGRTLNGKRALHGSLGRGRFYAYSLGHRAQWSSVSKVDGEYKKIEISGDLARIDGYSIGTPLAVSGPTGTTLLISVEQGHSLSPLLREDVTLQLAARFAAHLLGNADLVVRVNGEKVDPEPLTEGDPAEFTLDDVPANDLGPHERPIMTIIDWKDAMRSAPGVLLCNVSGMSLVEVEKSAPPGTVRSTGYLRWSGWAESGADLLVAQLQHPSIIEAGVSLLTRHVAHRTGRLTATIVSTLKQENAYPYPEEISDPVQDTERQLFDVLAVTARSSLRQSSRQQRKMTARLLQVALQERPESLDVILGEALSLSTNEREELAELLRFSSLGAIFGAAAEVTRRLDVLAALRHVIYSPDVAPQMREVDQLHPLVKDNVWLFGEPWRLSASEAGLTTVLRAVAPTNVALEADLRREGSEVLLPDGKRGRVDLLLQRTLMRPDDAQDRLVIELKRPSISLGESELAQVRQYAHALSEHPGAGPSGWTFWLVGADTKPVLDGELEQRDREWGHVVAAGKYDIWVTTWGRLIDQAERRFTFYREQLAYSVSQEDAVERVRSRHNELLPPESPR